LACMIFFQRHFLTCGLVSCPCEAQTFVFDLSPYGRQEGFRLEPKHD
jgi:hypothetical protein